MHKVGWMEHFQAHKCNITKMSENLFITFFQNTLWWQTFKKEQNWYFYLLFLISDSFQKTLFGLSWLKKLQVSYFLYPDFFKVKRLVVELGVHHYFVLVFIACCPDWLFFCQYRVILQICIHFNATIPDFCLQFPKNTKLTIRIIFDRSWSSLWHLQQAAETLKQVLLTLHYF